jgi:hypothetical protein
MSVVLWKMFYILVQHHVKMFIISGILSLVLKSYGGKALQKSVIFTTSTQRQSLTPEQLNSHSAASSVHHVTQDSNLVTDDSSGLSAYRN